MSLFINWQYRWQEYGPKLNQADILQQTLKYRFRQQWWVTTTISGWEWCHSFQLKSCLQPTIRGATSVLTTVLCDVTRSDKSDGRQTHAVFVTVFFSIPNQHTLYIYRLMAIRSVKRPIDYEFSYIQCQGYLNCQCGLDCIIIKPWKAWRYCIEKRQNEQKYTQRLKLTQCWKQWVLNL